MTSTARQPDPAPPAPILGTVSIGALADALGMSRSSVLRAVTALEIPDAEQRTIGGHRRWSLAAARTIVSNAGRPVPAAWGSP